MRTTLCHRKLEQALLSSDGQPWAGSRRPNPKLGSLGRQMMTRTSGLVFGPTGRLDGRGLHAQDPQRPKPNARPDGLLPLVLGQRGLGKPREASEIGSQGSPRRLSEGSPYSADAPINAANNLQRARASARDLAVKFAPAAKNNNIYHSAAARDCALICRPRDDFLEEMSPRRTGLQEPQGSPAAPWRPWHGPRSAQNGVWTALSSRLCERGRLRATQTAKLRLNLPSKGCESNSPQAYGIYPTAGLQNRFG
jgi:hypothetical protein